MSELKTTVAYAVAGVIAVGAALLLSPKEVDFSKPLDDSGQLFYPEFTDPLTCTAMEVSTYNEDLGLERQFKVQLKNGRWVIPSHHDYPADAKDNLKKVATSYIGIRKEAAVSDDPRDYERMGVIDPLDEKTTVRKGRGKHVTLRDRAGNALADFIIGKEVEGHPGEHYVRVPGTKRVYRTKIEAQIPTKFEDWIETDLLKIDTGDIKKITFNNYGIDNVKRDFTAEKETYSLVKKNDKWHIEDQRKEEKLKTDRVDDLLGALDDLKIVGVRLKPERFMLGTQVVDYLAYLKKFGHFKPTPPAKQISGQIVGIPSGFYLSAGQYVLGNKGQMTVETKDGLVYTLYHGSIAHGTGEELTAGAEKKKGEEKKVKAAGKKEDETAKGDNRYMMVTVYLDPKLLPAEPQPPAPPKKKKKAKKDKKDEKDKKDGAEDAAYKKAKQEYEKKHKEWKERVEKAKKKAAELQERFLNWYYVVPDKAFKKLRLSRKDIVEVEKKEKPGKEVTTKSGLKYVDLKIGSGAEAKTGQLVRVHYTGTLTDGTKFDSSRDRGKPLEFKIGAGKVIRGWDEGVVGMRVGGRRKLTVPPELGYGKKGFPPKIPPNATLVFEIELLSIIK